MLVTVQRDISLKKVIIKVKDFYTYNKFFRMITYTHIIALYMHHVKLNKIDNF